MLCPLMLHFRDALSAMSQFSLSVFYETQDFMAAFNIAPVLPGHSLVIPRTHHTSILSFTMRK